MILTFLISMCWGSGQDDFAKQIKGFKASDVPGYVTDTPSETRLNDPTRLDAAAQKGFTQNDAAAALLDSANTRPYFALDPQQDPIALNSKKALSDPQSFI